VIIQQLRLFVGGIDTGVVCVIVGRFICQA